MEAPWQVELSYRIVLDAGVVIVALGATKGVTWVATALGFDRIPLGPTLLLYIFNVSMVSVAAIMVVFDLARFAYRRTPKAWKGRIGWLGK